MPKVKLPRKCKNKKTNVIKHSTPLRKEKTSGEKFGSADEILSPIVDVSSNTSIKHDHTYSADDKDTAKLRKQVKIFEEANLSTMVDPCNTDQEDCSMSTEFPAHNVMESSIDYCDRMQISVGNDAEVNTLVTTEVNDTCTGSGSKSITEGVQYPAVVKVSKTADNELLDEDDDGNGSDKLVDGDREVNSILDEGFNADSRETSSEGSENSVTSPIFSAEVRPGTEDGAVNSVISAPNDGHNEISKEDGADDTVSSILFLLNSLDPADIEDNGEDGRNVSVPDPENTVTASNNDVCDSEATVTLSVNSEIENDKELTQPTVPEEENLLRLKVSGRD